MCITGNILYLCEEDYIGDENLIGITDSTEKAQAIITEFHQRYFDTNTSELNWIGSNGIYSCDVVAKDNKKLW